MSKRAGGFPRFEAECRARGQPVPRRTCRECGRPVTGRRSSWCSQECVDAFRGRTNPGFQRILVERRDRGVCHACGLDTGQMEREIQAQILERLAARIRAGTTTRRVAGQSDRAAIRNAVLLRAGYDPGKMRHREALWDMDHVEPLHNGGTNELDNLITLCVPCHKAKSAREAAARAKG